MYLEARGVVGPHGAQDDEELGLLRRGHAEAGVEADEGGADVEGGGGVVRHPLLVDLDQPGGGVEDIFRL